MRRNWRDNVITVLQILGMIVAVWAVVYFFQHFNEILNVKVPK